MFLLKNRWIKVSILLAVIALAMLFALAPTGAVFAAQPNQSCQAEPSSPGHASSAPGSAFNEVPGGVAGSVYAGSNPKLSLNPKAVAQYDVACFQVSNH